MQDLAYFHLCQEGISIAEGVTLPCGKVALSWFGASHSHGTFPSLEAFQKIQSQRPGRSIKPINLSQTANAYSKTFYLQRHEDWSGVSGTGLVAVGFEFERMVVLQWLSETGSTFWYETITAVEHIHGHEGRTIVVRP